jgi:TolB protein
MRPAWSSDGTRILFGARASRPAEDGQPIELFQIRPDGVEVGPLPGGPRRDYNHAFSPGGTLIAFDAHAAGAWESDDGLWELWLMNADGSGRRRLTDNTVNDWGPSWSPNGSRIVFLSGTSDVYDIYTMAPDGSDRRRLTHWTADFEGADKP